MLVRVEVDINEVGDEGELDLIVMAIHEHRKNGTFDEGVILEHPNAFYFICGGDDEIVVKSVDEESVEWKLYPIVSYKYFMKHYA